MTAFFYIAGVTVTILGILAIAVLFCVYVYVRVLGYPLHLHYENTKRNGHKQVKSLLEDVKTYKTVAESAERLYEEERQKGELIQAEYCTSVSDLLKYSSDEKMYCAIKSKMAMLIGNDIAKKFEPSILPLGEGKQKYSLMLKVKKI